jgi:hypothetical protein
MKKAVFACLALVPSMLLAAGAPAAKPQDKKGDGLVCREVEETGSRLSSQRVCMTREQWEASRRAARDAVSQAQMQQINPCGAATKC